MRKYPNYDPTNRDNPRNVGNHYHYDVAGVDVHDHPTTIATLMPASDAAVASVIAANSDEEHGMTRSEWLWLRLPNGDLMLACFPQDELYLSWEAEHS